MRFPRDHHYFKYLSLYILIMQSNSSPSLDDEMVEASRILSKTGRVH